MVAIRVKQVEMPGIEPGAFHMQSERSTTELHPLDIVEYPINKEMVAFRRSYYIQYICLDIIL
jgi:hypothetical protein